MGLGQRYLIRGGGHGQLKVLFKSSFFPNEYRFSMLAFFLTFLQYLIFLSTIDHFVIFDKVWIKDQNMTKHIQIIVFKAKL